MISRNQISGLKDKISICLSGLFFSICSTTTKNNGGVFNGNNGASPGIGDGLEPILFFTGGFQGGNLVGQGVNNPGSQGVTPGIGVFSEKSFDSSGFNGQGFGMGLGPGFGQGGQFAQGGFNQSGGLGADQGATGELNTQNFVSMFSGVNCVASVGREREEKGTSSPPKKGVKRGLLGGWVKGALGFLGVIAGYDDKKDPPKKMGRREKTPPRGRTPPGVRSYAWGHGGPGAGWARGAAPPRLCSPCLQGWQRLCKHSRQSNSLLPIKKAQ